MDVVWIQTVIDRTTEAEDALKKEKREKAAGEKKVAEKREKAAGEKKVAFKVVTQVTHTSGWEPLLGKALLCIVMLEYSDMTTTNDQNDLYLMKTMPTAPSRESSISAELHDEFMVTFIYASYKLLYQRETKLQDGRQVQYVRISASLG